MIIASWPECIQKLFSLSILSDFVTPQSAAGQASLSTTNSRSLLKFMSIKSLIPRSCHPLLLCLQSFPASGSFLKSQFSISDGQSTGVSASAPVLPVNIQDWFPLGLISLISLESKGLSRVFANTRVQKHQFFSVQLSLWSNSHIHS